MVYSDKIEHKIVGAENGAADKPEIMYVMGEFPTVSQTFILNQITDIIRRGYNISIYAWRKGDVELAHPEVRQFDLLDKTVFAPALPKTIFGRGWFALTKCHHTFSTFKFFLQMMSVRKFGWDNIVPFRRFIRGLHFSHYASNCCPDIIHFHFGNNAVVPVCAKKSGLFKNCKIVVTFHGYDLHNIRTGTYNKLFKLADMFTVNSDYSKSKLLEMGCSADKIVRLPVGLDCTVFTPAKEITSQKRMTNYHCATRRVAQTKSAPISERRINAPRASSPNLFEKFPKECLESFACDTIRLLYVGRLTEFKGIIIALQAFAAVRKKVNCDLYFDVVGDGELWSDVHNLAVKLNIDEKVVFHGSLKRDNIVSLMNSADIFLFPGITSSNGRQENQGLVIQEAQAMKLPVIVSDFGGVPEGMLDGKSGYVVKEGDVNAIVDKLELLISAPELRMEMGKVGRKYVEENFASAVVGNRLEKIYLELIA